MTAREKDFLNTVFLDLETTGTDSQVDEVLEIAIIGRFSDSESRPLLHSLCRPERVLEWSRAMSIHGISPEDVDSAPSFSSLLPTVASIIRGKNLVIYNADFDTKFLPAEILQEAQQISCCMKRFAEERSFPEWDENYQSWKWVKLSKACEEIGAHDNSWVEHTALGDAKACRAVWRWLECRK